MYNNPIALQHAKGQDYQLIAGLQATCPQTELKDYPVSLGGHMLLCTPGWNEMKWNEKPIVPWRAKASSFEGQLNVYACDELFRRIAATN